MFLTLKNEYGTLRSDVRRLKAVWQVDLVVQALRPAGSAYQVIGQQSRERGVAVK